ncbi:LacI family DNA-binding transcriptional regulator [Nocardioides sp. KIGAM211]|uniref:LacI family DNA-binding transcriptional regulator n=1 Tax=Nocardioides luti TaxID=2761101 RepID=A0A7X0VC20_9ACTN|nr:LacI family DNA-binding transcriptional regulator [Nocardioides luti]MBB6627793.1 LacI family DNA-binding transcriptional regulator [Nocardioides luti]
MPDRGRQPTMADVALRARVSHQTVSRVINEMAGVRPATEQRVRAAIEELGYRRNLSARLLASRRSGLIGVVVWASGQFGPQQTLLAVDLAAGAAGFDLVVRTVHEITEEAIRVRLHELLQHGVEAVLVLVPHETAVRVAGSERLDVPVVVLEGGGRTDTSCVTIDNEEGARLATRHLLELGHETVVHVAGPTDWTESGARVRGWREELLAQGRPVPPLRWAGDWSARSGHAAGRALAREPDVTAVFAANDQMALGLVAALADAGRSVPGDVSVVGFDDLPEAPFFQPPLTTVRQDFGELGRRAVAMVTELVHGSEPSVFRPVPTSLVVRASTAPRRAVPAG